MGWLSGGNAILQIKSQISVDTFEVEVSFCGSNAILKVPSSVALKVNECKSITVFDFRVSWYEDKIYINTDAKSIFLFHPCESRGKYHLAELFGGLGGWSNASHCFKTKPLMIVDHDSKTARMCAKTWSARVFTIDDFLVKIFANEIDSNMTYVVQADINDMRVWSAITALNINFIMMSPPCQPWSSAGSGLGLAALDGAVFANSLKHAAESKIQIVVAENVAGFAKHEDFKIVVAEAAMLGLHLVIDGVHKLNHVFPVVRDRWLGTFLSTSLKYNKDLLQRAQHLTLNGWIDSTPSLANCDVIHVNISRDEKFDLSIPDQLDRLLDLKEMMPKWLLQRVAIDHRNPIKQARTIEQNEAIPAIMARYGSQHLLPENHLRSKGLQTVIFHDGCDLRLFSPWEFAAALGFGENLVLSICPEDAFQQIGNSISVGHAWLQLMKSHMILGENSPFHVDQDISSMIRDFQANAIKMSKYKVVRANDCQYLIPFVDDVNHVEPPAPKKLKTVPISPTIPFLVQEDFVTKRLDFDPVFHQIFPGIEDVDVAHPLCQGGILVLKHIQGNWMMVTQGPSSVVLAECIQRALPHAKTHHFDAFAIDDKTVHWDSSVCCCPAVTITFEPATFQVVCRYESTLAISIIIDVTWTVRTALAYIASNIKCNPDVLSLKFGDLWTKEDDFLLEYEKFDFDITFKACLPGYMSFVKPVQEVEIEGLSPTTPGRVRFVARHPSKKITISVCVSHDQPICDVMRLCFPDLVGHIAWKVTDGEGQNCVHSTCGSVPFVDIEWVCFKPLVVTRLERCECNMPIDDPLCKWPNDKTFITRWIKTPFATKAKIIEVPDDMSVMQLAASFVAHAQCKVSVMCQVGPNIVDPNMMIGEIDAAWILSFKITPLRGGAKAEPLKDKIRALLETKGVPRELCNERTSNFLSKADHETILKADLSNADALWEAIKNEANRVKFRLVLHSELTAQKKENRHKPPSREGRKDKRSKQDGSEFDVSPENIMIDINHFKVGDANIGRLDAARFGPDQTGIAIMNATEASKHQNFGSLSPDGLAILVIDKNLSGYKDVFVMPAHTASGKPVAVRAAFINFGDQKVSYVAAVPSIKTELFRATIIEFHIVKSLVSSWKDCSNPLHYIGVHVPCLRGNNLLASWSHKTWSNERKPTPFQNADYWHGFFKIEDTHLETTLIRSGMAGIFLTPKSPDKKHDDRFAIIPMPSCTLPEVQQKAQSCDKALGITKVRDHFAIRCKCEFVSKLRAVLFPESACVDTDGFEVDEKLWILKNVPPIAKDALNKGLLDAKWEAHTVRSQGHDRWIVASKHMPNANHLVINDCLVLIEPFMRAKEQIPVTFTAKEFKVDAIVDPNTGNYQVSTTSRIAEVKAEMSDQINQVVQQKLEEANKRIDQLTDALKAAQDQQQETTAEMKQVRDEQAFARQKIEEVEKAVSVSSQTVVTQVQSMMQQMQKNLESSMFQAMQGRLAADECKRPRIGENQDMDTGS